MSSSSVSASASSSSVSSSSSPEELPKPRVSDAAPAATPPPAKKSNSTRQRQATGQLFVSPRRASSKPRPSVAMVKDDDSSSDSLPQDLQVAARTGDEEEGGTGATGSTGADHDKFDVVEWWVLGHPLDVLYAWRSLLSEFLGTLLFVFMGTGSVLATVALTGNGLDGGTIATIGLAFGLAIATMVYATANLSGGHLNPAVTIAISAAMKMPLLQGFAYIVSQLLGALVGSALLRAVTPYEIGASVGFGCTTLARNITTVLPDGTVHVWDVSLVQGVFFELIVTFVLVFTVFSTAGVAADSKSVGRFAPLSIGFAVLVCVMVAAPFTGGSLNPARSFGPAVVAGTCWDGHWVYWVGPIVGGLLAGLTYKYLFVTKDELRQAVRVAEQMAIEQERQARLGR